MFAVHATDPCRWRDGRSRACGADSVGVRCGGPLDKVRKPMIFGLAASGRASAERRLDRRQDWVAGRVSFSAPHVCKDATQDSLSSVEPAHRSAKLHNHGGCGRGGGSVSRRVQRLQPVMHGRA
ncbi:MAG: hypothetical protein FE78DRAFT_73342 [Acidomyces sp. 'richmondensis']|nr:MAG: hypothetical protein FE78DRAFT_73342 [Acidomyces sp. 'richmondensis']